MYLRHVCISLALVQSATQADKNFLNQNLVFVPYLMVILIPSVGDPGIIDLLNNENNKSTSKKPLTLQIWDFIPLLILYFLRQLV